MDDMGRVCVWVRRGEKEGGVVVSLDCSERQAWLVVMGGKLDSVKKRGFSHSGNGF